MRPDDQRERAHPSRSRRVRTPRWRLYLLVALLAGASGGCAGMPPPSPPSQLPDDSYSGGSNFGGRPMYLGPQT